MSYIRAGSKKRFSNSDNEGLYVFNHVDGYIEDYGALNNSEDFCEVMFRVLSQGGVDVTLEMVNKARDRLGLEPIQEIQGGGKTEKFKEGLENE